MNDVSGVRYWGQHITTTPGLEIFVGTRNICQILHVIIAYILFYTREYSPPVFICDLLTVITREVPRQEIWAMVQLPFMYFTEKLKFCR